MNNAKSMQRSAVAKFRALHESGCFILPNPWDVGTAVYLQHLNFKALATTSAGFAFSRGKPDAGVSLDEMLAHIGEVVSATPLPAVLFTSTPGCRICPTPGCRICASIAPSGKLPSLTIFICCLFNKR